MVLLIKRNIHQDKRKSQDRVMIPETVIHRFIQFPLNVRLLIRAALDAADQIIRIRKRPEDLIFIFLFETGDQRDGRMPPPDAVRFLQKRIQRQRHMNVFLPDHPPDDPGEQPRCIYECNVYLCHDSLPLLCIFFPYWN